MKKAIIGLATILAVCGSLTEENKNLENHIGGQDPVELILFYSPYYSRETVGSLVAPEDWSDEEVIARYFSDRGINASEYDSLVVEKVHADGRFDKFEILNVTMAYKVPTMISSPSRMTP